MRIETGEAESHPTPLPVDTTHTPAVAAPTPRFPSGTEQGGVLMDTSGVDFTGEAAAAMAAAMSAESGRRGRYAADMSPLGASYGDEMTLPPVVSDTSKHTGGSDATAYDPAG